MVKKNDDKCVSLDKVKDGGDYDHDHLEQEMNEYFHGHRLEQEMNEYFHGLEKGVDKGGGDHDRLEQEMNEYFHGLER